MSRSSEHISHEKCVICSCAESSNFYLMLWVPASVTVYHDASILVINIINGQFLYQLELGLFNWNVNFSPVDSLGRNVVLNDSGVLWLSSSLEARVCTQGSIR